MVHGVWIRRCIASAALVAAVLGSPARASIQGYPIGELEVRTLTNEKLPGQSQGPLTARFKHNPNGDTLASNTSPDFTLYAFCAQARTVGTGYRSIAGAGLTNTDGLTLSGYAAWVYDQFLGLGYPDQLGSVPAGFAAANPGMDAEKLWGTAMDYYQAAVWAGIVRAKGVGGEDSLLGVLKEDNSSTSFAVLAGYWGYDVDGQGVKTLGAGNTAGLVALGIDYDAFMSDTAWPDKDDVRNYRILRISGSQDLLVRVDPIPEPAGAAVWLLLTAAALVMWRRRERAPR